MPTLTGIRFENHQGVFDLSTPIYPSAIDYALVTPEVRSHLQLEPAFQLIGPDLPDLIDFTFELDPDDKNAELTMKEGQPYISKLFGADIATLVVSQNDSIHCCTIRVDNSKLQNDPVQRVHAFRIHCSPKADKLKSRSDWGVTLVLLKPGRDPAEDGTGKKPGPPDLTVNVKFEGLIPVYDVFKYKMAEPGISYEPCFRVGCKRPLARAAIQSADPGKAFLAVENKNDDFKVWKRNSPRPAELSDVTGVDKTASFSYDSTFSVDSPNDPVRIFSFMMDLTDLLPQLTAGIPNAARCAASLPITSVPSRPRPGRFHVDPVILHDPPPMLIP